MANNMKAPSFTSSLKHALRGIKVVYKSEHNFRIQSFFAILVLCSSIFLQVKIWEMILLLLLITSVLVLELLNSVIERIADGLKPRLQPIVRDIKDLMAGAVLLVSLLSAIVGATILLPYVVELLRLDLITVWQV